MLSLRNERNGGLSDRRSSYYIGARLEIRKDHTKSFTFSSKSSGFGSTALENDAGEEGDK